RGSDRDGGECSLMDNPFSKATDLASGATVALPGASFFTAFAMSHNVAFSPLTLTRVLPSRLNARPPPSYPLNAPCSRPVCASQKLGREYMVLRAGKNKSPPSRSSTGLPGATSHRRVLTFTFVAILLLPGLNERGWPSSLKRNLPSRTRHRSVSPNSQARI